METPNKLIDVSFVVPVLEEENIISKLLNNLKEIKSFSYEIIVSDGGSKDKTVEISKKIANQVVENISGQRQTIAQGRNAGAKVASGEIVLFLDADVYLPNIDSILSDAIKQFSENPKLTGLSGWIRVYPEMETWMDYIGYVILVDCVFYIQNNWFGTGATCGEFQMMRKKDFETLGGFREDLVAAEDLNLFHRLATLGQTKTDPKILIYHTGRRPHKIGWPKLIGQWIGNWFYLTFFNKSQSKEWKVIR
jgi:glycosyltransferase involved in cell wall biosynthesis